MSTPSLPLIGLKGRRKSGKDTIAGILTAKFGYTRRAFADNLKREVYDAFGRALLKHIWETVDDSALWKEFISFESWMTWLDEHKNDPLVTAVDNEQVSSQYAWVGPLLQWWGTEFRRHKYGDTYWLDQLRPQLGPGVVVTDVRFPNEADLIRECGGIVVHVDRPRAQEDGGARGSSHASEALMESIPSNLTINNTGTLEDLEWIVVNTLDLARMGLLGRQVVV